MRPTRAGSCALAVSIACALTPSVAVGAPPAERVFDLGIRSEFGTSVRILSATTEGESKVRIIDFGGDRILAFGRKAIFRLLRTGRAGDVGLRIEFLVPAFAGNREAKLTLTATPSGSSIDLQCVTRPTRAAARPPDYACITPGWAWKRPEDRHFIMRIGERRRLVPR
jgi:hypothetical protein